MENTENMIEWQTNARTTTVTFTNPKHIRKIKELYEEHAEDFRYFKLNKDGSVCAKIPLKWIRISAGRTGSKREMTEEQKQALRERLAAGREKANKKK